MRRHFGAKIQNGYKILSIDTYHKGKLAYPYFSEVGVEVPEGLNWSPIIANLLGSWNWNLQNPHQFHNQDIKDIDTRRTQEKILVEIKKYLVNE